MNILALIGKYWEIGVGAIMALLLWIVSLQRKTIKKKKAEVETLEKAVEIAVKVAEVKDTVAEEIQEHAVKEEKVEDEIQETETINESIDVGNSIVDDFNKSGKL